MRVCVYTYTYKYKSLLFILAPKVGRRKMVRSVFRSNACYFSFLYTERQRIHNIFVYCGHENRFISTLPALRRGLCDSLAVIVGLYARTPIAAVTTSLRVSRLGALGTLLFSRIIIIIFFALCNNKPYTTRVAHCYAAMCNARTRTYTALL